MRDAENLVRTSQVFRLDLDRRKPQDHTTSHRALPKIPPRLTLVASRVLHLTPRNQKESHMDMAEVQQQLVLELVLVHMEHTNTRNPENLVMSLAAFHLDQDRHRLQHRLPFHRTTIKG